MKSFDDGKFNLKYISHFLYKGNSKLKQFKKLFNFVFAKKFICYAFNLLLA